MSMGNSVNYKKRILKSLNQSYDRILVNYEFINGEVRNNREIVPSAEWLLDNIYLIEKEYKTIKKNMPYSYFERLPISNKHNTNTCPRVYTLAHEYINNYDGEVEREQLVNFINDFQAKENLTLGELWAFPLMLRIAIMEKLALICEDLSYIQREKRKGEVLAEKIIELYHGKEALEGDNLEKALAEITIEKQESKEKQSLEEFLNKLLKDEVISSEALEKLIRVLRDNSVDEKRIYDWIETKVDGSVVTSVIEGDYKNQGKIQISIGNCITALRNIDALTWNDVFKEISAVEKILSTDPHGTYKTMNFETQDYYRHKLEVIALKSGVDEIKVAKTAIQLSELAKSLREEEYKTHVGYYLIDEGRRELEKNFGYFSRINKYSNPSLNAKLYIGLIILSIIAIEWIVALIVNGFGISMALWKWSLGALILLIPISEVVVALINWSCSKLVEPCFIPKLDLSKGIGKENKTIVVIPAIIQNGDKVKKLMEKLEVYHISNKDPNIYFALIGDHLDSKSEKEEKDEIINKVGISESERLNRKYGYEKNPHFYFFNRKRIFNEKQRVFMGWERKRGKLMEFMALLKGEATTFNILSSSIEELKDCKYIITLDEDTKLPLNTGKKLVGAMSHILNIPYIDKDNRVTRGYGLMQPKVSVSIEDSSKTLFSKVFSGETGMDIYTTAVSDTYQDLFGEGIFTGKGILDIDVFYKILKAEIPENAVLSHDLLEGSYCRCALVTDIDLIDGYPAFYKASCERLHRWVRGDWQLLPWLFSSRLNILSRWKIMDNIRRSLLAPSILIGLYLGAGLYSGIENLPLILLLGIVIPVIFNITDLVVTPKNIFIGTFKNLKQIFFILSFIPNQARLMIDAIFRTLYRLTISKSNMLQWKTAEQSEKNCGTGIENYIRFMWLSPLLGAGLIALSYYNSKALALVNLPISIIWILSPFIANEISKPLKKERKEISDEDKNFIREVCRRTWAYYEDFVNSENNYLAPDNYQEEPNNGVAYRTSPTNVAMGIMANIVAYDLGYIGIEEVLKRTNATLDSMDTLEKYNGHLLNWYDTRTKMPLYPRYVSTVDSGNLVSYLWVAREAFTEYLGHNLINKNKLYGLLDVISLVEKEIEKEYFIAEKNKINVGNTEASEYIELLKEIEKKSLELQEEYEKELLYWNNKLLTQCRGLIKEFNGYKESNISIREHHSLKKSIELLCERLTKMVEETDFSVLYSKDRKIFSIGYDLENKTLGNSCYDLLASEARAASFMAIAKGDVPQEHWFKLGRAMTNSFSLHSLVSWSGTMFEYFMPPLIMKNYPNTLFDVTYSSVIKAQKSYAHKRKIPWGISESAFYHFDVAMNYQYKAFGVPGIGLKRGLVDELVVAPYASIMALPFASKDVIENLKVLKEMGMLGRYGFYEALDFTKERISKSKNRAEVKCFMVHHQGMALMAMDNFLKNNILQNRFHSIPQVKAYELLLQEKARKELTFTREQEIELPEKQVEDETLFLREYPFITETPQVLALSNGSYSTMITNSGGGYSKKDEMMVYRWREDAVQEPFGNFIYIKNLNSNEYWSNTFEPARIRGEEEWVNFSLNKGEFHRKDGNIETLTEVAVSNEDNLEVRRITLKNHSDSSRTIELTSYMEVTLTTYAADIVHPTFSNLFIITEYDEANKMIIGNRRPRAKGQKKPYIFHSVVIQGEQVGALSYETSRVNFIGRNRDLINPKVMDNDAPLENTHGIVLDPVFSMRARVKVPANESSTVCFITGVGDSKEEVADLCRKYKDGSSIERVFRGSRESTLLELKFLGIKSFQGNLYQCLASNILFLNPWRRERKDYIEGISRHQSSLWSYGISGDLPIIMVIINSQEHLDLVRSVVSMSLYWRSKGIKADLIIYDDEEASYDQPVQKSIIEVVNSSLARDNWNKPGGVFLHSKATMGEDIKNFLLGIARVVFYGEKGSLLEQSKIKISEDREKNIDYFHRHKELKEGKAFKYREDLMKYNRNIRDEQEKAPHSLEDKNTEIIEKELEVRRSLSKKFGKYDLSNLDFFNGYGGFTEEGAYKILLKDFDETPAPWVNVMSNDDFGFHISESGVAYTWCGNSRENKITPWNNDWIKDSLGEALYIRDDVKGEVFSVTPKPLRDGGEYLIEHNFGYSRFIHEYDGINGELTCFCSMNEGVKYYLVELENQRKEAVELTLFYYAQMVLGVVPEQSAIYVSSKIDKENNFIWAHNPYSEHFGKLKAYLKILGGTEESFTGNRKEFLGREGTVDFPEALKKKNLSNNFGGGLDPCLASSVKVKIPAGEKKKVVIMLGQNESLARIKEVISYSKEIDNVEKELKNTKEYWRNFLGNIRVKTPDKTMDYMLNGWLMYQTLSCRFWSRTAFYQSGGAYGFRDQLQDSLALGILNEEFTRSQILRNASRQYEEGDVQHWWHPVVNSGIRTRFSDDLLWLPYAVGKYIERTGDYTILEEKAPYLKDSPLAEGEDERYTIVDTSETIGTIYEHCLRAIERGLKFGENNIPLMGSGDWNDGMSTVGNKGKGESVWLGWFLYDILESFIPLCNHKYDLENIKRFEEMQQFIKENLEKNAWDGGWYRRAYFDDGTPLGSVKNDECSIDSLSQSWSVISGAGKSSRAKEAMEAVERHLVKEDKGIILLLAPPFNNSKLEPGYIKGYVPGVRENGGQYTHAAVWVVMALTKLGLGDKAWKYYNMINPINHSNSLLEARKYKVEPYVMTADVYIKEPHGGRGGWSWYTGASGWFYKVGIEDILGLKPYYGKGFNIEPCIPSHWKEYEINYKYKGSQYNIRIERNNEEREKQIFIDGRPFNGKFIPYGEKAVYDILIKI